MNFTDDIGYLYRSLSASLQELRQVRSSCHLFCLSVRRLGVNHGFLLRGVTVTVFKGACLSRMRLIVELKNFTRESRSRFSALEKAAAISLLNSKISR